MIVSQVDAIKMFVKKERNNGASVNETMTAVKICLVLTYNRQKDV